MAGASWHRLAPRIARACFVLIGKTLSTLMENKMKNALLTTFGVIALLVGCNNAKTPQAATQAQSPADKEAAAKGKLKGALDAWVFGDSCKDFKKKHPEFASDCFWPAGWDLGDKLLRYEMGASRPHEGFDATDISVTLVYESKAGTEVKKGVVFTITPPPNPDHIGGPSAEKWMVQ